MLGCEDLCVNELYLHPIERCIIGSNKLPFLSVFLCLGVKVCVSMNSTFTQFLWNIIHASTDSEWIITSFHDCSDIIETTLFIILLYVEVILTINNAFSIWFFSIVVEKTLVLKKIHVFFNSSEMNDRIFSFFFIFFYFFFTCLFPVGNKIIKTWLQECKSLEIFILPPQFNQADKEGEKKWM